MNLVLKSSDWETRVSVRPRSYDAKRRRSRKGGLSYRFINQVRYDIDYEGSDVKRSVEGRSISTYDIERICVAADAVLSGRAKELSVSSRKRDLKLTLAKKPDKYWLSLEFASDQGRMSICLTNLDRADFCRYCAVFYHWKILYPVLCEQELNRDYRNDPYWETIDQRQAKISPGSRDILRFNELMEEADGKNWRDELWGDLDDLLGDDDELDL